MSTKLCPYRITGSGETGGICILYHKSHNLAAHYVAFSLSTPHRIRTCNKSSVVTCDIRFTNGASVDLSGTRASEGAGLLLWRSLVRAIDYA